MDRKLSEVDYRLHYGDNTRNAPDWRWNSRSNGWTGLLLWYVNSGMGQLRMQDGREYRLVAGDCLIYDMRMPHLASNDPDYPLEIFALAFHTFDSEGRAIDQSTLRYPPFTRMQNPEFARGLMEAGVKAWWSGGDCDQARHWVRSMIICIEEQTALLQASGLKLERARQIDEICNEIRRHPDRRPSTEELAASVNCSREHFIRIFKQYTGQSPGDYIVHFRINAARELLRYTSKSINEVALSLGYRDQYFFSRQFKQIAGVTPTAYRKQRWILDYGNVVG